jgi:hypothetical protein
MSRNQKSFSRSLFSSSFGRHLRRDLRCARWLPSYAWQRLTRPVPRGNVHLILAVADHFEPAIVPGDGRARACYSEQEKRLDFWCSEYPRRFDRWRDHEGRPLTHTYFYPAEQYDLALVERLAEHCRRGWGEIEIHLHHGVDTPDTAERTRQQLIEFRDALVSRHASLSFWEGSGQPRYAFVHGNFALANSAGGHGCGVDSEMQILAETGCYADLTLPAAALHPAQIGKINSLYECSLPLASRAPHRRGRDLRVGHQVQIFPLMIQGPLALDFDRGARNRIARVENAALTVENPPSLRRLKLWKDAAIIVRGRPDWLFIKLHCHGMDPMHREAILGTPMQQLLAELPQWGGVVHFVTAREMANVILAACNGCEGNPGDYRDYRLKLIRQASRPVASGDTSQMSVKG